jgi:hypothetical protein
MSIGSEIEKLLIWNLGLEVPGYDPKVYRKDQFGWWMKYDQHGQCTEYGWEIDHIRPVGLGGGEALTNKQPLHWRNNRLKSNRFIG